MEERLLTLDLRHESSGRSKHERLREHFVDEMLNGRLRPGQSLPSERRLAEVLGVAYTTVRQAMAGLENEGLIRRVQGKGTFVESDVRCKLQQGLDIFALVVPETRAAFYPSLIHGFETAASDIQHQTIICNTNDDVARQADIILQLMDKKVGGIAINPSDLQPTPAYQIRQLHERGIPVVFCHRGVKGIAAPLLLLPFREVGRMAGNALIEQGHRRLAFFTGRPAPSEVKAFEEGFREAIPAGVSDIASESIYVDLEEFESHCWAAMQEMFAKPNPPTGIFASFDPLAEIIYLMLLRLGLRVPEDVSVIGFGGTWREGGLTRRLTSVVVDEVATGRQAVSLLDEMRRGERALDDNMEIVLPISLSEGETLGRGRG